ncbi:MAG: 7-cyano-7-deazaguanine synthase [Planctomycetota bacterium]
MKRVLITCDNTSITNVPSIQNQIFDSTFPIKRLPPNENLNLKITNITHCILNNLDPILLDLLELAAFVYAADSDVVRGTETTIFEGEEWQRDFTFIIPSQNPNLWNSAPINSHLKQMLEFLTGDKFNFHFVQGTPYPSQTLIEFIGENLPPFQGADCVSLFSGGLDSLTGVVTDVVQGKKPLLVSHRSYGPMDHMQKELVGLLKNRLPQWVFPHLSLWANRHGKRKTEYTQRSRSLLYFSLATVVAAQCDIDTIRFYENGTITFNLPLLAENVGTRLTRTTHPRFISDFSKLVKLILPAKDIKYENPFLWKTKEEIVGDLKNNGLAELMGGTVSCTRSWMMTKIARHCGVCSQCVDRRFAAESQGVQQHDPIHGYGTDIFTRDLKDGTDKSCVAGYIQTAVKISKITRAEQLFIEYPELYGVFNYLDGNSSDKANNIFGLFQRHSSNVINVMDRMVEKHADDLVKGKLPESCLISMVGARQHLNQSASNKPSINVIGSDSTQKNNEIEQEPYAYRLTHDTSVGQKEILTKQQYDKLAAQSDKFDIFIDGTKSNHPYSKKNKKNKIEKGHLNDIEFALIREYIETRKTMRPAVTETIKGYNKAVAEAEKKRIIGDESAIKYLESARGKVDIEINRYKWSVFKRGKQISPSTPSDCFLFDPPSDFKYCIVIKVS